MLIVNTQYYNRYPQYKINRSKQEFDKVTFTSTRKNAYYGADYFVVERFKPPIEKFDSTKDLQKFAAEKCKKIINTDYKGKTQSIEKKRKAILRKWFNYLTKEDPKYTPSQQLIILDGITRNLKPYSENLPPRFDKTALANVMAEFEKKKLNQFNFLKEYKREIFDYPEGASYTGWVEIPSKSHDFWHFKSNVKKLQAFSHKNWCTSGNFYSEAYLEQGDFHIYLEQGNPKLAVRFEENGIKEIQGADNNRSIPWEYYDIFWDHFDDIKSREKNKSWFQKFFDNKEIHLAIDDAETEIELFKACSISKTVKDIKKKYANDLKNKNFEKILPLIGAKVIGKDKYGMLTLSEYDTLNNDVKLSYLGLDENEVFKKVKKIKGDAIFAKSELKSLYNLEEIDGDANFETSKIKNTGHLKYVGGDLIVKRSHLTSLGEIETVDGNVDLPNSQIEDLGELRNVGGSISLNNCRIKDLGNLEYVGDTLVIEDCDINTLANLKYAGNIDISGSKVKDLGALNKVENSLIMYNTEIESLKDLEYVGNNLILADSLHIPSYRKPANTSLSDLGKLKYVGQTSYIPTNCPLKEELEKISQKGVKILK